MSLPSSVSEEQSTMQEQRMDGEGMHVFVGGGRGRKPPHPENLIYHSFISECRVLLYTYEYTDNTALCVNLYISITYRVIMEGETDSLSLIQEESCWSWSPTLLQICSEQTRLRNLQRQRNRQHS